MLAVDSGTITKLVAQRKNPNRVNVYLDGEYAFGVYSDLVLEFGLHAGRRLTAEERAAIAAADGVLVAKARAIHYLAHRPRTEQEVRRKLARAETPPEVVDAVIERLYALHYLDDAAYARRYARARYRNKGYGPERIRAELFRRGVPKADAEAAVASLLEAEEPVEAARHHAARRWARLAREPDPRKRRKKLSDFLLRRGYTYDTVRRVVDELAGDD